MQTTSSLMSRLRRPLTLAAFLATVTSGALAHAAARTFEINAAGSSRVTFESDAPVENIVGVTTAVSGTLVLDVAAPTKGAAANAAVDLTQLKTGIDKRDQHMRSADFLDTANHPTATFQLTSIDLDGDPRAAGGTTAVGHGKLTIKGVAKDIDVPIKLQFRKLDDQLKKLGFKGDVLRATGRFTILLSDYGIKVPSMMGQKVSNSIEISVALTGVAK